MVTGEIIRIEPAAIGAGRPLNILISFNAFYEGIWGDWRTRLTATLDGQSDSDEQTHIGEEGHRDDEELRLGVMPAKPVSGSITLTGKSPLPWDKWHTLDVKTFKIELPEEIVPVTPMPPEYPSILNPSAPSSPTRPDYPGILPSPSPSEGEPGTEADPVGAKQNMWLWGGLAVATVVGIVIWRGK